MTESVMSDDLQAHSADSGSGADTSAGGRLIAAERAREYQDRWTSLKGEFVDNPRRTLLDIDGLVGEVLDELEKTFQRQRGEIESGVRDDGSSTEELRVAFGRYREFFDRLLAI